MKTIEEAREILCRQVEQLNEWEEIPLQEAVGRVLAKTQTALFDQPPFPRSPLDGYAVKGKETTDASKENPVELKVIGKVYAGSVFEGVVGEGEAVRIMTGAPIPEGADTVIRQEDTDEGIEMVNIYRGSKSYQNYCPQGEDYKAGTEILPKGTYIDGVALAVLASLGITKVPVIRQPRVAVLSTGDEVVQPGSSLLPGKIYDANLHYILGRMVEIGKMMPTPAHCDDNLEDIVRTIKHLAEEMDVIITTGGVSVGEKDLMHGVVETLGAERLFWRVSLKPGAPTLAAVYQGTLIICLSGNPFGAAANFELLVRPVLAKLTGNDNWKMKRVEAVLEGNSPKKGGVRRFMRGNYSFGRAQISGGNHASGALSSMLGCNGLIEIAEDQEAKEGDRVWVHLL